jgi:hypothetical protein
VIAEHYDPVHARLADTAPIAGNLHDSALVGHDGKLVRATYWVLFGGTPDELGDGRLAQPQTPNADAVFVYTVRSVSTTAAGCRAAQGAAFARLVGFAPHVEGRSCASLALTRADAPRPDYEVAPPLYYADDEYTLRSSRA